MSTISKIINFVALSMLIAVFALAAAACGQETATTDEQPSSQEPAEVVADLPEAPDFTLPAANRDSTEVSLSQFRGDKPVVLVFYRAYW